MKRSLSFLATAIIGFSAVSMASVSAVAANDTVITETEENVVTTNAPEQTNPTETTTTTTEQLVYAEPVCYIKKVSELDQCQ